MQEGIWEAKDSSSKALNDLKNYTVFWLCWLPTLLKQY